MILLSFGTDDCQSTLVLNIKINNMSKRVWTFLKYICLNLWLFYFQQCCISTTWKCSTKYRNICCGTDAVHNIKHLTCRFADIKISKQNLEMIFRAIAWFLQCHLVDFVVVFLCVCVYVCVVHNLTLWFRRLSFGVKNTHQERCRSDGKTSKRKKTK